MVEFLTALWVFFTTGIFVVRIITDDIRASGVMLTFSMVCLAALCISPNVITYLVPFFLISMACVVCVYTFITYKGE